MKNSIIGTIELRAPLSRVWRALTDHREFGEWFRVEIDGPFRVGEVSTGHMTYPGWEHFPWYATVTAMEEEKRFAYSWCPYSDNPDADFSREPTTLVEFRLEAITGGTRLTVEESGFNDLPDDERRVEVMRMNTRGWEEQMKNIEAFLDG